MRLNSHSACAGRMMRAWATQCGCGSALHGCPPCACFRLLHQGESKKQTESKSESSFQVLGAQGAVLLWPFLRLDAFLPFMCASMHLAVAVGTLQCLRARAGHIAEAHGLTFGTWLCPFVELHGQVNDVCVVDLQFSASCPTPVCSA